MVSSFLVDGAMPRKAEKLADEGNAIEPLNPVFVPDLAASGPLNAQTEHATRSTDMELSVLRSEIAALKFATDGKTFREQSNRSPRLERVPTAAIRAAETIGRRCPEPSDLADLTASIKHNGLVQPLLVRADQDRAGTFEVFAGYRRWRAAVMAGITPVPAIVFPHLSDAVALELGLLENLHRRNLTAIEEAEAFHVLIARFGRTHHQVAVLTSRSRSHISNILRLLDLPDEVKNIMHKGRIKFGHGRALLSAIDPVGLARRVVDERLTVRQTELAAAQGAVSLSLCTPASQDRGFADDIRKLRDELSAVIGNECKVHIGRRNTKLLIHGGSASKLGAVVTALRNGLALRMKRGGFFGGLR